MDTLSRTIPVGRRWYRYTLTETANFHDAEDTLHLAVLAVEARVGEGRVRLDARFSIDEAARMICIDAATPTGEALNETFVYLLVKELGLGAFTVKSVRRSRRTRDARA